MKKIDLTEAKKMVDHYHATRKTVIDKTHGINDTKSVWFDIDAFKDFVNKLPAHATGVRVHLASYDETHPTTPGQTTVMLAGTVSKDSNHTDALSDNSLLAEGLDPVNQGKNCPPDCTA
ncbi:hypothetical protein [Mucilaginibacter ginsenosidivorax]|uniref:Uncharacterized protein n=1 Tax=Mucilaginibacter ginsenosidivorax TaxID=862126 RepID=A0A5B8W1R3_9SPHI|nr:hypothetical protein [Mucilaginibacter ginsenosidivorax]QEC76852.1 hypothetical protein FSB76_13190 [Mucilaginibacter ginsenosidivorax]